MKSALTLLALAACGILHAAPAGKDLDKEVAATTLVRQDQAAPDCTCQTTDGKTFNLADCKGKVVVIFFFAESVPFSITQMKYLEKEVYQKLSNRDDFAIIGIGRGHTREEVVKAGGENNLTFPLAPDPELKCYNRYFTKFVPRTIVVRKNGTIAYLAAGYQEYDSILKLQAVLARELMVKAP